MNVVLAVRQAHARLALELVLCEEPGMIVVGMASETERLLALAQTAHPDLVVLEWGLPGRPTAAVIADAHARAGRLQFLVLGRDPALRQLALLAGAYAFVLVGDPPDLLLAALREVRGAAPQRCAYREIGGPHPLFHSPATTREEQGGPANTKILVSSAQAAVGVTGSRCTL